MIGANWRLKPRMLFGRSLADAERVSSFDVLLQTVSAVVVVVAERGSLAQAELVHSLRRGSLANAEAVQSLR